MKLVFLFTYCPPPHLYALKRWQIGIASTAECPLVERVVDVEAYIGDKFVVVVGDRELAKRLGVAYATEEEVEKFLAWLSRELSPDLKPYLQ